MLSAIIAISPSPAKRLHKAPHVDQGRRLIVGVVRDNLRSAVRGEGKLFWTNCKDDLQLQMHVHHHLLSVFAARARTEKRLGELGHDAIASRVGDFL
jgi:hypothetical protein